MERRTRKRTNEIPWLQTRPFFLFDLKTNSGNDARTGTEITRVFTEYLLGFYSLEFGKTKQSREREKLGEFVSVFDLASVSHATAKKINNEFELPACVCVCVCVCVHCVLSVHCRALVCLQGRTFA